MPCGLGNESARMKSWRESALAAMGEVFRALRADDQYKREVAIKLVRVGADADSVIRRFKQRAADSGQPRSSQYCAFA